MVQLQSSECGRHTQDQFISCSQVTLVLSFAYTNMQTAPRPYTRTETLWSQQEHKWLYPKLVRLYIPSNTPNLSLSLSLSLLLYHFFHNIGMPAQLAQNNSLKKRAMCKATKLGLVKLRAGISDIFANRRDQGILGVVGVREIRWKMEMWIGSMFNNGWSLRDMEKNNPISICVRHKLYTRHAGQ